MTDDLVAFLRSCLDDEQRAAEAAFSNQADPENGWGIDGLAVTPHVGVIHEDVQRQHVAQWDPARVLAEVAAKRAILDEHELIGSDLYNDGISWCQTCSPRTSGPCTTVRLLAQPYRGEPGWLDEWTVDTH